MKSRPLAERFWEKVSKTEECWLWSACLATNGYGQIRDGDRMRLVHRVSYEMFFGPIPDGLFVDHLCFNRACVNPEHLRLATNKQNGENRRGANQNGRGAEVRSGVRGVFWDRAKNKWVAAVNHNGRYYLAGRFSSIEEAQDAVVRKRIELFTHNEEDKIS